MAFYDLQTWKDGEEKYKRSLETLEKLKQKEEVSTKGERGGRLWKTGQRKPRKKKSTKSISENYLFETWKQKQIKFLLLSEKNFFFWCSVWSFINCFRFLRFRLFLRSDCSWWTFSDNEHGKQRIFVVRHLSQNGR